MAVVKTKKQFQKSILVVEDEEDLASEIIDLLEDNDYHVVHATTANTASWMITNQKFDCILMDINLEAGFGDQVVEFMRSDSRGINFKTPVILASSHISKKTVGRIGKDIQGALVKPYKFQDLLSKIKDILVPS